jgi:Nif-specific regulatory protein
MASDPIRSLPLPGGYRVVRDRSRAGAPERLLEAEWRGGRVALRVAPGDAPAETLAELDALSTVAAPGLARMVDHGVLPGGGGTYVAREWIDGVDLATWARVRGNEEIGAAVARACAALGELHARGFVHADLKAENVIVAPGGEVALTDFGLARRRGGAGGAIAGTLFSIAPEVLRGAPPDARADLFAVGVMLHELLLRRRASAREFYGRFPTEDFFAATGTRAEELPSFARDVVASLVERDPARRPESAADVARTLAGRLGLDLRSFGGEARAQWTALEGRTAWADRALDEIARTRLVWLAAPVDESAGAFADALAARAAVKGLRAQRVEPPHGATAVEIARWSADIAREQPGSVLLAALEDVDASAAAALDLLANAVAPPDGAGAGAATTRPRALAVVASFAPPHAARAWSAIEVPPVDAAMVRAFLDARISAATESERERVARFAALAAAAARGSATLAAAVLSRAGRDGWLLAGDRELRLRPGPLPDSLESGGAARAGGVLARWRAGEVDAARIAQECEGLRERGAPELALQLAEAALASARAPSVELRGESALAWCALGHAERALDAVGDLEPSDPRTRAIVERVRGHVAALGHDPRSALEHFTRARELDPDDGGAALLAQARLAYDAHRDEEVLELARDARERGRGAVRARAWANLLAIEAMSRFRRGDAARASELLRSYVADAERAGDAVREAGLLINLATVERRAGDPGRAVAAFERAAQLYDRAGLLHGLAQARALLGGALRDAGDLRRAESEVASAAAIRERLGDRAGAAAARGMLGLALAERGHVRAAIEELERSARDLRAASKSGDAALLEARAAECRARVGSHRREPVATEAGRAAEGDPRVLIASARASWLGGEIEAAADLARRASALAARLGLAAQQREADLLSLWLASDWSAAEALVAGDSGVAAEDARALALLARAPLDVERARELARSLAERGRDDRAARLYAAIAARPTSPAHDDLARAETLLAACTLGLGDGEARALRAALFAIPDPWPEDWTSLDRRRATPEEDEMDLLRVLEINHRLVAQEDLRSLLGTIVEQALAVSGAQRGFLILEEAGELAVDTALDSRRGGVDAADVEVSGTVLREALRKMKPLRVSNAVDDPLLGHAPSVVSLELRSILCVPFEVQRGLRGAIYVDHRLRESAFDARTERLLSLLADQAALAIQQVRRLEEIRRLNRELGRQVARKESDLETAKASLRAAQLPLPAGGLVGDSPPMRAVRALIERAAQARLPVLVTGPSGSGKELAARALHELSPRSAGPFVVENSAALPPTLVEAELFGARKGAFTGADRDREGLFERASGGTLFLDEIGELPLDLQAKLLRVLETGEVRRLGDDKVRAVDVRLVAATNRDLGREVAEGRFRADLYYRLDALRIAMPTLDERAEDVPALVEHWLRLDAEPGKTPRRIAPAVVARLARRRWPGNVRELFNEVARLSVVSERDEIDDPALVREAESLARDGEAPAESGVLTLEELERRAILRAIEVAGGDKRRAAEMLGISRAKVYQRLKDWGLTGGA